MSQDKKEQVNGVSLSVYPQIQFDSVEFPNEIFIAYAVCTKNCGNKEFIVDGETQVCKNYQYNHIPHNKMLDGVPVHLNFDSKLSDYPEIDPNSVHFPTEICIVYAICRKECGNREFLIDNQTDICEYCGHHMLHTVGKNIF